MSYFPCTVAVAGFSSNPEVSFVVANKSATWWLYADWVNSNSGASLSVSGGPLLLSQLKMKADILTFGFADSFAASAADAYMSPVTSPHGGLVMPTIFAFNLHVCRNGTIPLELSLRTDAPAIAAFTFDKVTWYPITEVQTQIQWPN